FRQSGRGNDARYISDVRLGDPGGAAPPPFGRLLGDGLDARLFTDLSQLRNPDDLRTPAEKFFVRTAAPPALPPADGWTLHIGGLVQAGIDLRLRDLEPLAAPPARVLLECSGNADQSHYGLLSAADWAGIPIAAILDRARPQRGNARVLVSG